MSGGDSADALLGVYKPQGPLFVKGEGAWLVADDGRRYLDFTSGIAVTALGHGHPEIAAAIERAAATGLLHTSNLYRTAPARELAAFLVDQTGMDRVFFCNSGGEAIEASLKFARRWAGTNRGSEARDFLALRGSFHGRLFGSLAITDRPGYREPFEPLMPGAHFVDPTDPRSLDRALDPERVAALVLEPIQGEGGVRPLGSPFLRKARELTRERGILLILDEVQCGLGRTGHFTAHEEAGIRPDILALAKPLAGGLPMGAVMVTEEVAASLSPGDHGTTFGGGPFVSTVALAVTRRLSDPDLLSDVREKGEALRGMLGHLQERKGGRIAEIRGRGLMWGVELSGPSAPVVAHALDEGLLLVGAGPNVVRLLPPLTVSTHELERGVSLLGEALDATVDAGA
ncbi:MAG: acetylornithine/succinylornithine family transaminase [Gemmatimonadales bacterium]|nr:MAG: acetylornithine/succinylornithine family transaminase [Gemmatimonadales bacterium]